MMVKLILQNLESLKVFLALQILKGFLIIYFFYEKSICSLNGKKYRITFVFVKIVLLNVIN